MSIEFNHTIIAAHDSKLSAHFLAEILGLPEPTRFGPFMVVKTDNRVSLDFMQTSKEIQPKHYAFLISETEHVFHASDKRKIGCGMGYDHARPINRHARAMRGH